MRKSMFTRTVSAFAGTLGVVMASNAGASSLGSFDNSASFNAQMGNTAVDASLRDANGNLVVVNGVMGQSNVNQVSGASQSGAGTGAAATAIGNSLNVQVQGSWNTVIVNSTQKNSGDQNATASLNGQLKL